MSRRYEVVQEAPVENLDARIEHLENEVQQREERVRTRIGRITAGLATYARNHIENLKRAGIDIMTLRPEELAHPQWRKCTVRLIRALDIYSDFVVQRISSLPLKAKVLLGGLFVINKSSVPVTIGVATGFADLNSSLAEEYSGYEAEAIAGDRDLSIPSANLEGIDSPEELRAAIENHEQWADMYNGIADAYEASSHTVSFGALFLVSLFIYWALRKKVKEAEQKKHDLSQ